MTKEKKNKWGFHKNGSICPTRGQFVVYKKLEHDAIAKLRIPADAKRVCPLLYRNVDFDQRGRKCRASKAKVLEITNRYGKSISQGLSMRARYVSSKKESQYLRYKVGEMVYPDKYNDNPSEVCTNGIHFFMTKKEAEMW